MELINNNIYLIKNQRIFPSNTYLYVFNKSNNCIIIDPGFDFEIIKNSIIEFGLKPILIFSTHGHFDHIAGVSFLKNYFNIPSCLHELDLKIMKSSNFFLKVAKIDFKIELQEPDFLFKGEIDTLKINDINLEVYLFPGHSPGSTILKIGHYLFSGDILYKNTIGKETIPKENKRLLKQSINKIFQIFSGNNLVFPGHGLFENLNRIKNENKALQIFLNEK